MNRKNSRNSFFLAWSVRLAFAVAVAVANFAGQPAQAQTFNVIHNFTGGADGADPIAGLTMDQAGNLYGTAQLGGHTRNGCPSGCGTVFELTSTGSTWVFNPIHTAGGDDYQHNRVIFGPDGSLYGTSGWGIGQVFNLKPPVTDCKTVLCSWTYTIIHGFDPQNGDVPGSEVAFDQDGNLWGTTLEGGCGEFGGALYEMTRAGRGWSYTERWGFCGSPDGDGPQSEVIFDKAGNVYGTTTNGGYYGYGTVYEYSPSTMQETVIYSFQDGNDGIFPVGGLVMDAASNLYGSSSTHGLAGGGTVFELTPSNGGWTFAVVYSLAGRGYEGEGPAASLTMDAAGNLYGTTQYDGAHRRGSVFKLTRTNGGWTYASLHDFTGGSDGQLPVSNVIFDVNGNLYGTASGGGRHNRWELSYRQQGCGVVWEITRESKRKLPSE